MELFPTQYSLLSAAALKESIGQNYGLINITCRLLIHNVSDTYIVENADEKYIFRVYRKTHRTLEQIKGELLLLNTLKEKGAKVAYPIPDAKGTEIQQFNAAEGIRYGVLFVYAKGSPVPKMTTAQLALVGREMAAIHNITANLELPFHRPEYAIDTVFNEPLETVKPAFKDLPDEYQFLETSVKLVKDKIAGFNLADFSYGYCHFDFLPKNFHFDGDDEVTFFDFDFAGPGYLINDIATFYAHFFIEVVLGIKTQEEADLSFGIFLQNYQSVRPLKPAEISAIPYFGYGFWTFYLGFQAANFEEWSNFFFGQRFLKERIGWQKKWMDWYVTDDLFYQKVENWKQAGHDD